MGHHYNNTLLLLLLFQLLVFFSNTTVQQNLPIISNSDLSALYEIKNSLTDISSSSPFFSTWNFKSPDPCSSFAGVTCTAVNSGQQRITSLTLGTGLSDSRGLAGSLPASLSSLTELTQLILFPGIVTGPIPPQLGSLKNLRVISLTNNRLTGPIPSAISALSNLHTLDLSYNQLTGSVPPNIRTGLPQLKVLVLSSNRLTGHLPELPTRLLHLDLKNNGISGNLLVQMPLTLRYLSLSLNKMWGPLNGLDSLSELVYLDLSMNKFSGPIPASLFHASLSSMFLQRNNLSGGVPSLSSTPFPSYGPGSIVDLSHNILTGELSTVLVGVESIFLNNNRLMGKVPDEYITSVNSGSTKTLYLQHNYISGFPKPGSVTPNSASVCLNYNCMVPPVWHTSCPASAGVELSRPANQCAVFYNRSSSTG